MKCKYCNSDINTDNKESYGYVKEGEFEIRKYFHRICLKIFDEVKIA